MNCDYWKAKFMWICYQICLYSMVLLVRDERNSGEPICDGIERIRKALF